MGMTQTQKILAAHAGLAEVKAGQLINAKLDIVLGNDITTPVAINEFEKAGFDGVFDKEHIAIVLDHFVPNKDIKSATQSKQCREFANKYDILNFYVNRSSNAAAESFNAKIKSFRASLRGIVDEKFFLYRLAKIYAYPH